MKLAIYLEKNFRLKEFETPHLNLKSIIGNKLKFLNTNDDIENLITHIVDLNESANS